MALIPPPSDTLVKRIYALHESMHAADEARTYLGCSALGNPCRRALWLEFRWTMRKMFEGRLLRLFDTGHREEARVIAELKQLEGITFVDHDANDPTQQIRVDLGCHVSGHLDGEILGLPEAPKTWHVFDAKTIKAKKFEELVKTHTKGGFRKMYPKYYAQGMLYMHARGRTRAAFLFINKDTDDMHLERFDYDAKEAKAILDKAKAIVMSRGAPEPIMGASPDWFECKFCDVRPMCSVSRDTYTAPARNCRTCDHVLSHTDGSWLCGVDEDGPDYLIPLEVQRVGCDQYKVNRDLAAPDAKKKKKALWQR